MGSVAVLRLVCNVPLRTSWEDIGPFLHHQGLHQNRCSWGQRQLWARAPEKQHENPWVSLHLLMELTPFPGAQCAAFKKAED